MAGYGSDEEEVEDAFDGGKQKVLRLISDMKAEAEQAKKDAWQEGHDKGYDEGYTAGHADGEAEMREKFYKKEKVKFT